MKEAAGIVLGAGAFAFSLLAAAGFTASPVLAGIIQYDFSPDASMTVMTVSGEGTATFAISGTFGYDTTTESAVDLDITYTLGASSETFTSYCPSDPSDCLGDTNIYDPEVIAFIATTASSDFTALAFDSSLALDADDPLTTFPPDDVGEFGAGCDCYALADAEGFALDVTGSADPVPASVPEPGSLALLSSGLVGFGVLRRRKRKAA